MALITIQVLDGADRGKTFESLATPITIGREEGNTIQLNDERVSRFHLKIQEDQDRLVLTDLQSTNGTKVNGEEMELRILRYGDMISVGRSVLRFGSREEIAERLADMRRDKRPSDGTDPRINAAKAAAAAGADHDSYDFAANFADDPDIQAALNSFEAPELPARLSPAQAAQLADILNFLHIRIRHLIEGVKMEREQEAVSLKQRQWQDLLELQLQLAAYLRTVGDPDARP